MAMLNNNNNANYLSKKVQYINILERKYRNCIKDNSHTFNIHTCTIRQNSVWTMHGRVNRPAHT